MNRTEIISAKFYKAQMEMLERSMGDILESDVPKTVRPDFESEILDGMKRKVADLIRNVSERIATSEGME